MNSVLRFGLQIHRPSTCALRWNSECRISANTWRFYSYTLLISYNPTQLPESCMRYHETSTDLHANYLSIYIYFYSFD
ncbi:hypothetical protein T4B_4344 [Trichinella pseudospiralis]|uniref:Uncharacterized protein n=1 Tax=Trichinella pseudospiralis TaxID=6337 RepID=A0A0V1JGL5_TRIPS|nr:hypothetical protein T4A_10752 [Trichinella pseudospiralis]KRZ34152.1 hypothetical protein T4B_4344 [Trichinella pseudospiralis]KRZ45014.1 hypothetical protein T4C_9944 [Trichinella pseudospiralis]